MLNSQNDTKPANENMISIHWTFFVLFMHRRTCTFIWSVRKKKKQQQQMFDMIDLLRKQFSIAENMSRIKLSPCFLSRCVHITNNGVGYLATMLSLTALFLRWCSHVQDVGLQQLCLMRNLQILSLAGKFATIVRCNIKV